MILKRISTILLMWIICSCNEKETETISIESISMSDAYFKAYSNDSLRTAKLHAALTDGDTLQYQSVNLDYHLGGTLYGKYHFFYYTMKMLSKHKYSGAYYDAYLKLQSINREDQLLQMMGRYYLYKAFLGGNIEAKYDIEKVYGNQVPRDSINNYIKSVDDFAKSIYKIDTIKLLSPDRFDMD